MISNLIIRTFVLEIRGKLCQKYIIEDGANVDYRGLCDLAHEMLVDTINLYNLRHGTEYIVNQYHGELKHTLGSNPKDWQYQHTWSSITEKDGSSEVFVDCTCQQFQWKYGDGIPDYYISTEPPHWFYPDNKNPYFKWGKRNKIIGKIIYVGQYYFWWHLSEFVRVWKMG